MKSQIIAGALFATGFLILGVLTANLMAPPEPKPQAQVPPANPSPSRSGFSSDAVLGSGGPAQPAAQSYPAAMPPTHAPAAASLKPGMALPVPGVAPPMPSLSSAGMPGMPSGGGGASGASNPMNISAPSAIPAPRPSNIEPTNSVPVIQPTDLGTQTSPTAAKQHQ
ncbi:MAG TPA: hypothetical protein VK432_03540 [Stellaceae bacterium]|nr:hypothetical protein [Stellaceae bacterium]